MSPDIGRREMTDNIAGKAQFTESIMQKPYVIIHTHISLDGRIHVVELPQVRDDQPAVPGGWPSSPTRRFMTLTATSTGG